MVQLFYYETRGKCCRKVFNYEGYPTKVLLFPYEGWAQPALISYWTLKTYWWSRSKCKIVEVIGSKKSTTKGKMVDKGNGTMMIQGKFKEQPQPDFRMHLTTNVSQADFQLGYCVTGTLERGDKKAGVFSSRTLPWSREEAIDLPCSTEDVLNNSASRIGIIDM